MKQGKYRCKKCKHEIYVQNDAYYSDYRDTQQDVHEAILEHIMECQFDFIQENEDEW